LTFPRCCLHLGAYCALPGISASRRCRSPEIADPQPNASASVAWLLTPANFSMSTPRTLPNVRSRDPDSAFNARQRARACRGDTYAGEPVDEIHGRCWSWDEYFSGSPFPLSDRSTPGIHAPSLRPIDRCWLARRARAQISHSKPHNSANRGKSTAF